MLSKRVAQFDKAECVACGACVKECPRAAINIYKGCYAVNDLQLCIGCGKCAKICPSGCIAIIERQADHEKAE